MIVAMVREGNKVTYTSDSGGKIVFLCEENSLGGVCVGANVPKHSDEFIALFNEVTQFNQEY